MVAEKSMKEQGSHSMEPANTKHCALEIHSFHISNTGTAHSGESAVKIWREESEALNFWAQAKEVARSFANKYVKDELSRASSNRFLLKHLLSRFICSLFVIEMLPLLFTR